MTLPARWTWWNMTELHTELMLSKISGSLLPETLQGKIKTRRPHIWLSIFGWQHQGFLKLSLNQPMEILLRHMFPIGSRHLSKTISLPLWLSHHHLPVQLEGSALMRTGGPALLPSGTVTWMEKHHSNNKSERVMYTIAIFNYQRDPKGT